MACRPACGAGLGCAGRARRLGVRWLLGEQLAADSETQMLLPIPKSVRARGKALERTLQSLLAQGFGGQACRRGVAV
jgi:hypothetical protein